MKIILLNDKSIYNIRYRNFLLTEFSRYLKSSFEAIGLFDSRYSLIKAIYFRLINAYFVSSNLRSNLFSLLVLSRGIVILNGLGRYQHNKCFICFFKFLVRLNGKRKIYFVQRYRDYRWMRRFHKSSDVVWMLGSGAYELPVISTIAQNSFVVITRPEKLQLMEAQLSIAVKKLGIDILYIYGISEQYSFGVEPDCKIIICDYVSPENFFTKCSRFLQIDGYGEGFPHSLAYALCSKVDIVICRSLYRSLGLSQLPVSVSSDLDEFVFVNGENKLNQLMSNESVYSEIINTAISQVDFHRSTFR